MNEQTIFSAALERPLAERAKFLDSACAHDPAMRERIQKLLASHEVVPSFLNHPAAIATVDYSSTMEQLVGTQIGPYKLREQIGEGGMGVVYVAEQTEPIKRKVALKIIKPGMASRDVVARFDAERQALAMMDHPNIAKVFDGGATDAGQPYFVMELVQGPPITEYCDQHKLGTRQRLELFETVCRAVQHAHQKGVIHRDLKPSNVLVPLIDGKPVPKVIDFGVAKAIGQKLTEQTVYTQFSQLVGTPLYMSPEQAELGVVDIDTRSDVYSLGVLLYELLTGSTPFDSETLKKAGLDEMRRIIREEEPLRPSARVSTLAAEAQSTVAASRGSDPRQLGSSFQGELDWLVMKTLEKDRNRRYESPSALASDIERYLTGEPVEACPPSAIYRFRKFASRNKVALTTAAIVMITMLMGIAGTSWQAWRATENLFVAEENAAKAEQSAAESQALVEFFVDDLIGSFDPWENRGKDITLREILLQKDQDIGSRFEDQPLLEAKVREAIADIYSSLADYDNAKRHMRRALELRRKALGTDSLTITTQTHLSEILGKQSRTQEAYSLIVETVREAEQHLGADHLDTLEAKNQLGSILQDRLRFDEAVQIFAELYPVLRDRLGAEHEYTLTVQHNLSNALDLAGRKEEALALLEDVVSSSRRIFGPESYHAISSATQLAQRHYWAKEFDKAKEELDHLLELVNRNFGSNDPRTLELQTYLALTQLKLGDENMREKLMDLGQVAYGLQLWPTLSHIAWNSIAKTRGRSQAKMCFWRSIACSHGDSEPEAEFARSIYKMGVEIMEKSFPEDAELMHLRDEAKALLGSSNSDPDKSKAEELAD